MTIVPKTLVWGVGAFSASDSDPARDDAFGAQLLSFWDALVAEL